jgi:hypothetical protein
LALGLGRQGGVCQAIRDRRTVRITFSELVRFLGIWGAMGSVHFSGHYSWIWFLSSEFLLIVVISTVVNI